MKRCLSGVNRTILTSSDLATSKQSNSRESTTSATSNRTLISLTGSSHPSSIRKAKVPTRGRMGLRVRTQYSSPIAIFSSRRCKSTQRIQASLRTTTRLTWVSQASRRTNHVIEAVRISGMNKHICKSSSSSSRAPSTMVKQMHLDRHRN